MSHVPGVASPVYLGATMDTLHQMALVADGVERLCRYGARPAFSHTRLGRDIRGPVFHALMDWRSDERR